MSYEVVLGYLGLFGPAALGVVAFLRVVSVEIDRRAQEIELERAAIAPAAPGATSPAA